MNGFGLSIENAGQQQLRVAMVSDFFFPNTGGVETHIFMVSQCLMRMGHKVVVLTHSYGDRKGVRWMANGLKVYYLPVVPFHQSATLPTLFFSLPLFRHILLRERINIIHAHQAFSMVSFPFSFPFSFMIDIVRFPLVC